MSLCLCVPLSGSFIVPSFVLLYGNCCARKMVKCVCINVCLRVPRVAPSVDVNSLITGREKKKSNQPARQAVSQSVSTYLLDSQSYVPCFICHEQSQSCHLIRSCSNATAGGGRKTNPSSSLFLSHSLILLIFNELALFPLLSLSLSQAAPRCFCLKERQRERDKCHRRRGQQRRRHPCLSLHLNAML